PCWKTVPAKERCLFDSYEVRIPSKWVLAGEHAVLRGHPAVVIPCSQYSLDWRFLPSEEGRLEIEAESALSAALEEILPESRPAGQLKIRSSIPVSAGLGSSAALCVGMVRWLGHLHRTTPEDRELTEWQRATGLEDRFHGNSSGMDVAAILADGPI